MSNKQIWQGIVSDCQSSQKTINCGSTLRRAAILDTDRILEELYKALKEMNRGNFIDPQDYNCVWERAMPTDKAVRMAFQALSKVEGKDD